MALGLEKLGYVELGERHLKGKRVNVSAIARYAKCYGYCDRKQTYASTPRDACSHILP